MTNFDTARDALETSLNSSGSALAEHEKWQDSLEAHINSLKASWQSLSQTFMDSDFLKDTIDLVTGLIDAIDSLIDNFGILGTAVGGIGLKKIFNNFSAPIIDKSTGEVIKDGGKYAGMFEGLGETLKNDINLMKSAATQSGKLGERIKEVGSAGKKAGIHIRDSFKESSKQIKTMAADIGTLLAVMGAMKAISDIATWISEIGEETETAAEEFDRISNELSSVDSELSSLESELSSVEGQIDSLLAKGELTFADEEELSRLKNISSELEHQIKLTETLQESLQKSLSITSINAYGDYANDTSFYSNQSKIERKEEAKAMGTSIGNVAGLIIGGIIGTAAGGQTLLGAGIGSAIGSLGGSAIGGAISDIKYSNETTVREMLDNMRLERTRLEKAEYDAYNAYTSDRSNSNKEEWEEASAALNDYNTALSNHISQLSQYYNAVDYASLATKTQREEYLKMGDDIDKYNIEMGVSGAKAAAFERIFSEELITDEAEELKREIEAALNSNDDVRFYDFDSSQFTNMKNRLLDMGLTLTDAISYFKDLKEAQEEASNYETYDIVKEIALLSDGVESLTDAFVEFNEQGIVTAKTLVALHEVFGDLGEDWTNYVDVVTSGTHSIEEAREATEKLTESHLNSLFSNGGIKFNKYNEENNGYEFDEDSYKTYLSTINELDYLGVENAKEYTDALQQQAMVRESVSQMRADAAEKESLLAKKTLEEKEQARLDELNSKKIDDYISDVQNEYGIELKNTSLLEKQFNLEDYQDKAKEYEKYLSNIKGKLNDYESSIQKEEDLLTSYNDTEAKMKDLYDQGYYKSGGTWTELGHAMLESISFGYAETPYDTQDKYLEDLIAYTDSMLEEKESREEYFQELIDIAKKANIDLSDIETGKFDPNEYGDGSIFNQVYNRVKTELENVNYQELADEISSDIDSELDNLGLEIDFGRNFDKIVVDGFKTKIGQLNSAMSEMYSGEGLSTDSIIAIDDIFGDLASYNYSKLFEDTANGIHLNSKEFRKLRDEFKTVNIDGLEDKISDLGNQYIETKEELYKLTYGTEEYNAKARELDDIEKQIEANEELMSQYRGLFSLFQEWQRVESAGSERDMYESIIDGFKNVDDEMSRGWLDDGTIEFLRLIKGDALSATASTKELMQAYKSLDDEIGESGYSIRDFFTVDEDGNSTNTGVYNFLETVESMESKLGDVVKRDANGNIIGFDFEVAGGDKAIADATGISEELVQIMVRASNDAGFVVSMDGTFMQLDVLKEKAQESADRLNELKKTNYEFNLGTNEITGSGSITEQYEEALKLWSEYSKNKNEDGTINMEVEGAEEAYTLVSTLQTMIDKVSEPVYMKLDVSQVDKDIQEPLSKLQEYEQLTKQENQLLLNGVDTTEIEKDKSKIIEFFNGLDEETKIRLGIENDSIEEIQRKVESGEIEIPAVVDLQVEMNDSLRDMVNLLMYGAGLIDKVELEKRVDVSSQQEVEENIIVHKKPIRKKTEDTTSTPSWEYALSSEKATEALAFVQVSGAEDVEDLSNKLAGLEDTQIVAMAEVFGKIEVQELKDAMSSLTDEQVQAIAEAMGKGDVEGLKAAISSLDDKQVQAIAKAFGHDDVNSLYEAIDKLDPKTIQAIAEVFGTEDAEGLKSAIDRLTDKNVEAVASITGKEDVDALWWSIDAFTDVNVDVGAEVSGKDDVDSLQGSIDGLKDKTVTVTTVGKAIGTIAGNTIKNMWNGADDGNKGDRISNLNGTANVNGTSGRAFKRGDWRTKKTETALTGELGREIVVTPNNQWHTVGDNGAEFTRIPKGSIVFNHKQTEELLSKGKATSGGGRARALVSGTAFAQGTAFSNGVGGAVAKAVGDGISIKADKVEVEAKNSTNKNSSKGDGGTGKVDGKGVKSDKDSTKEENKFEETIDFVEIALSRIQREIDNIDKKVKNVYKSWSERNTALTKEINKVGDEIALQQSAAQKYLEEAKQVGLSESYAKKIREGSLSIEDFEGESDEKLVEKIKDYQKWYEKYLDCIDAVEELREQESKLYAQRFENIQSQYDGILQGYEHTESMLDEYISQAEAQGHIVSEKYYNALINNEKQNIAQLQKEQADLIKARDEAVANNAIKKYSQDWYDMCGEIDSVTQAIEESNTKLLEFENSIRELNWEKFDLIQERISDIGTEAEFLIELMSNKDLFNDDGKLTEQGAATMGLHALNYNKAMYQSEDYGKEIAKLDKEIAKDPYDQELIERRRELVELQRDSILEAENQKNAIRDLVENGINLELDALQERINLHNEELDSMRDLYDYQRNVEKQTQNISDLRKQLSSYDGFDDEETRAKVQELKVSLEEAEADLKETEWDRYITQQSQLLDTLYTDYETILNTRLDNIDFLLQQVIDGINATTNLSKEQSDALLSALGADGTLASALGVEGAIASAVVEAVSEQGGIHKILNKEVTAVGTTLSSAMNSIWSVGDGNAKSILTMYGTNFQNQQTTTNQTLSGIKISVDKMANASNKEAEKKVAANKTSTSAKKDPTKDNTTKKPTTTTQKQAATNKSSGDGKAAVGDKVKFISGKYYYDSEGKTPAGSKNLGKEVYITKINTKSWATHPYHISTGKTLGSGDLGWLKKSQISGYATGKKNFVDDEYAWTQENGKEFIVRPSDGAILTPIAKGDSVLNATASGNIWSMANNPSEFIKNNLGLDGANIPNGTNVNNSYSQHIDNVVFRMDNVKNYDEMLSQMRKDKNFEKLVLSLSIDRLAGKSSLAKNKSIR